MTTAHTSVDSQAYLIHKESRNQKIDSLVLPVVRHVTRGMLNITLDILKNAAYLLLYGRRHGQKITCVLCKGTELHPHIAGSKWLRCICQNIATERGLIMKIGSNYTVLTMKWVAIIRINGINCHER